MFFFFFFQAEDGIRDHCVTGVQTCALPIFDQKFWDYELSRIQRSREQSFACSMLLARRLMPGAPNHKLGTLTTWAQLPNTGKAHRAMADAEMAANLTVHLSNELRQTHGIAGVSHQLLCTLQKVPAAKVGEALKRHRGV